MLTFDGLRTLGLGRLLSKLVLSGARGLFPRGWRQRRRVGLGLPLAAAPAEGGGEGGGSWHHAIKGDGMQGRGARVQARVAARTRGCAAARQWRGLQQGQRGGSALSYLLQQLPLHDTHGEEA